MVTINYVASIGETVRRIRLLRGISQAELAKRCGLSPGHISEIENGQKKALQARTLKKLAHGLGVNIGELLDTIVVKEG